jgi:hypothetical protein
LLKPLKAASAQNIRWHDFRNAAISDRGSS